MGDPTQGVPWAIWGRFEPFCPPLTPFWDHVGQILIWPYLGLCGSNINFKESCPKYNPPICVAFTPQNGPDTPVDPSFGSRLSILPHCGRPNNGRTYHGPCPAILSQFACPKPHFGLIVRQHRDLTVSWATWLKSQDRRHFPQVHHFLWFPSLIMAQTHPWTRGWDIFNLNFF